VGRFVTIWEPASFCKRTVIHGVSYVLSLFIKDVSLQYMNSKKEVETINHNYLYIILLQWTDINVFINSDLNPDKHNTRTLYIHLFAFLRYVSVVPSNHHEVENTSTFTHIPIIKHCMMQVVERIVNYTKKIKTVW
jgi:hypothetical protein